MALRRALRDLVATTFALVLLTGAPLPAGPHAHGGGIGSGQHHGSGHDDPTRGDHGARSCCLLGLACCVAPQGLAAPEPVRPVTAVAEAHFVLPPPARRGAYHVVHLLPYPLGPPVDASLA